MGHAGVSFACGFAHDALPNGALLIATRLCFWVSARRHGRLQFFFEYGPASVGQTSHLFLEGAHVHPTASPFFWLFPCCALWCRRLRCVEPVKGMRLASCVEATCYDDLVGRSSFGTQRSCHEVQTLSLQRRHGIDVSYSYISHLGCACAPSFHFPRWSFPHTPLPLLERARLLRNRCSAWASSTCAQSQI